MLYIRHLLKLMNKIKGNFTLGVDFMVTPTIQAINKAKSPEAQRKRIESRKRNGNLKHSEESKKRIGESVRQFYALYGG